MTIFPRIGYHSSAMVCHGYISAYGEKKPKSHPSGICAHLEISPEFGLYLVAKRRGKLASHKVAGLASKTVSSRRDGGDQSFYLILSVFPSSLQDKLTACPTLTLACQANFQGRSATIEMWVVYPFLENSRCTLCTRSFSSSSNQILLDGRHRIQSHPQASQKSKQVKAGQSRSRLVKAGQTIFLPLPCFIPLTGAPSTASARRKIILLSRDGARRSNRIVQGCNARFHRGILSPWRGEGGIPVCE